MSNQNAIEPNNDATQNAAHSRPSCVLDWATSFGGSGLHLVGGDMVIFSRSWQRSARTEREPSALELAQVCPDGVS